MILTKIVRLSWELTALKKMGLKDTKFGERIGKIEICSMFTVSVKPKLYLLIEISK